MQHFSINHFSSFLAVRDRDGQQSVDRLKFLRSRKFCAPGERLPVHPVLVFSRSSPCFSPDLPAAHVMRQPVQLRLLSELKGISSPILLLMKKGNPRVSGLIC
jgi:hypothetical protein